MARSQRGGPPLQPTAKAQKEAERAAKELDLTESEDEKNLALVFRFLQRGYSDTLIVRICRGELRIGAVATRTLIGRVRDRERVAMEERKPYVRAEQVARVRSLIEELKKPRFKIVKRKVKVDGEVVSKEVEEEVPLNAQAILRAEELLADLEGNRAPTKVQHEHEFKGAAMQVFANLSRERYDALLERARHRRLVARSITTEGTPVE